MGNARGRQRNAWQMKRSSDADEMQLKDRRVETEKEDANMRHTRERKKKKADRQADEGEKGVFGVLACGPG